MVAVRKRPVTVEAHQWDGTPQGATPIIDWVLDHGSTAVWREAQEAVEYQMPDGTVRGAPAQPEGIYIHSLEGEMRADPGDWIIRGVHSEFYPCKPHVFAATYDPVDDVAPMRTFDLVRTKDLSGLSGTGKVAQGVEFTDGTVVMRWHELLPETEAYKRGVRATTVHFPSITAVEALHGHNGATKVVWR